MGWNPYNYMQAILDMYIFLGERTDVLNQILKAVSDLEHIKNH